MMQNAILKFYSHNLIEVEDLDKIKQSFEAIDQNGDGTLSYAEVTKIMEGKGKKEESKEIFKLMDYNKDKSVSYKEFIKSFIDRQRIKHEENLKRCFDAIDSQKDGKFEVRYICCVSADSADNLKFKKDFYKYSDGKHYVSLISCPMLIL